MNERYVYVTQNPSEYYFAYASPDEKNIVLLQLTTFNSQVVYVVSYGNVADYTSARQLHAATILGLLPPLAQLGQCDFAKTVDCLDEPNVFLK